MAYFSARYNCINNEQIPSQKYLTCWLALGLLPTKMDFLKKAQKSLEEVQGGLTKEFKSLNFGKKNDGAAPAASERGSVAGPASTITTQSDTTSTPVLTPATTISQDPSEVKVPHCTAAGAPSKIPLAGRKKSMFIIGERKRSNDNTYTQYEMISKQKSPN